MEAEDEKTAEHDRAGNKRKSRYRDRRGRKREREREREWRRVELVNGNVAG